MRRTEYIGSNWDSIPKNCRLCTKSDTRSPGRPTWRMCAGPRETRRDSKSPSRPRSRRTLCACASAAARRGRPAVERCALSARTKRSPWQRLDGVSDVLAGGLTANPPGPYASRGLLASVLRTFHGSQRRNFLVQLLGASKDAMTILFTTHDADFVRASGAEVFSMDRIFSLS